MNTPFAKAWKYTMALFSAKIDEHADPKIQIKQAIDHARRQHQALSQQAAQVIGNQRQLQMRLHRELAEIESLHLNVRQAITLADQAATTGDAGKAAEYSSTAESFATQLVNAESSAEELKVLTDQALAAATSAKQAVDRNTLTVQAKIAEHTKLLSQLEQAKMQEHITTALQSIGRYTGAANTISLDDVRDKIERRYADALGATELAQSTTAARMIDVQQDSLQLAGHARLQQIRATMQRPTGTRELQA